jgi:hypothetical protein
MIRALRALARLVPSREKQPAEVWTRALVRLDCAGFKYRDRQTGALRHAAAGEVVELDPVTLQSVRKKVAVI